MLRVLNLIDELKTDKDPQKTLCNLFENMRANSDASIGTWGYTREGGQHIVFIPSYYRGLDSPYFRSVKISITPEAGIATVTVKVREQDMECALKEAKPFVEELEKSSIQNCGYQIVRTLYLK